MSRNISEKARFHPTAKGARRKPPSLRGLSRSQNRNKLKIVEGVAGVWHYHLSETGENYKPALCGKVEVMRTEIPLTAWAIKSHLNETYCKECEQLAGKRLKRTP